MTLSKLRERTAYWQQKLMLGNWTIVSRWAVEGEAEGSWGFVHTCSNMEYAEIVMEPNQTDIEYWLIHELNHIIVVNFGKENSDELEEVIVNRYTKILAKAEGIPFPLKPWLPVQTAE
jgi:hypothetical protein